MAYLQFSETSTYYQPFYQYGREAGLSGWRPVWSGLMQTPANSSACVVSQQLANGPEPHPEPEYSYHVQMINPKRVLVQMWHGVSHQFSSPAALN